MSCMSIEPGWGSHSYRRDAQTLQVGGKLTQVRLYRLRFRFTFRWRLNSMFMRLKKKQHVQVGLRTARKVLLRFKIDDALFLYSICQSVGWTDNFQACFLIIRVRAHAKQQGLARRGGVWGGVWLTLSPSTGDTICLNFQVKNAGLYAFLQKNYLLAEPGQGA